MSHSCVSCLVNSNSISLRSSIVRLITRYVRSLSNIVKQSNTLGERRSIKTTRKTHYAHFEHIELEKELKINVY
jgi:hypothetical protein